ncbi:MAG: hypothetical protein JKY56_18345 [Kofleriaceae bacterium]|nr:hypothetical protein [Kofleriaceae bacterium]
MKSAWVLSVAVAVAVSLLTNVAQADNVVTNTEHAEDLLVVDRQLWVATRGGIEVYSIGSEVRETIFTSEDGLARNHVVDLALVEGKIRARTLEHRCTMENARFECVKSTLYKTTPKKHVRHRGFRVTATAVVGDTSYLATAGDGVWKVRGNSQKRITAKGQICSNHITAIQSYAGRTWFGSFDEGLCSTTDMVHFKTHEFGALMVNDLEVTPRGLFIAASEGLFVTRDGEHFERNTWVSQRGVNGLAFDGKSLFVSSLSCLWRIRIRGGPRDQEWWAPGGSRSLQSVAATDKGVWLATEDRGLVQQTKEGFQVFDRSAGLPESWMLDVAIDTRGNVYGASLRSGVVRIASTGTIQSIKSTDKEWGLFMGRVGTDIWFGSQNGAARKDGASFVRQITPHPNVHVIAQIGSDLFFGTEGGLLVRSADERGSR